MLLLVNFTLEIIILEKLCFECKMSTSDKLFSRKPTYEMSLERILISTTQIIVMSHHLNTTKVDSF